MIKTKIDKMLRRIMFMTVLTIGLFCVGASYTMAQTKSVDGEWDVAMNTPGGVRNFKVVFKVDGEKLTGTVKRSAGDVPLTGTVKGSDVQFTYSIRYNDNDLAISMTGKVDGDSIKGTVSFGGAAEDEWAAKRATETKPTAQ